MSRRIVSLLAIALCCLCSLAAIGIAAPVAQEPIVSGGGGYPKAWPAGPPESSAPDWARPGTIRFARWDGGPIETAKGFLSGWPGMNPPIPDFVYSTTNWYDPSTVKFLRDAHVNLIWVTFSAGFSIPTEKVQRDLLKVYIEECHKYGIHVMAYESVANMFWEEMFQNMPESKSWVLYSGGKPVPYGAGDYTKMGRVTRYMADLSKQGWRDLLFKRIDLAIEAKADGVMYDNVLAGPTMDTIKLFEQIMKYTLQRKSDFLIMANFHRDKYIVNRLLNCITTEDGGESGVFSEVNLKRCPRAGERPWMLKVDGGYLVNNAGLFRTFENLAEGWKPVMVESNLREVGVREKDFMRPERQQLAIAEPMMFGGVSNELFAELRFANDLHRAQPAAMGAWKAIGQYYGFMADHTEYYRGARSAATLAMILDNRSEGQATMNGLAARSVLYNVFYEHELTPEKLKPYAAVVLLSADTMRDRSLTALEDYVTGGGKLFAIGAAATKDEAGKARKRPAWFGKKLGQGEATYLEKTPPMDELTKTLLAADRPPLAKLQAPQGVLYNITRQVDNGRMMVHVLNYLPKPVEKVVVTVEGRHEKVSLLVPEDPNAQARIVRVTDSATEIEIPSLKIYAVLVLDGEQQ
jgi:hypothetical protein